MKKKVEELKHLIQDLDGSASIVLPVGTAERTFELSFDQDLLAGLSGWLGAFTVRAMLSRLKIDEHRIFKWRPENKYIQYLIFSHYAPGCVPKTIGLNRLLKRGDWVSRIRSLIGSGFFIKATLGFGSGRARNFDRTSEIEQILDEHNFEKWMIQKKLKLKKEFRIHTFGSDVLYGMTFRISGAAEPPDYDAPQQFTRQVLEKLPPSLRESTLIGWDIGLTSKGKYYVIEANFTGFHPEYHPGFQTSGYFEEAFCGPIICAWLNAYFRYKYGVSIRGVNDDLIAKAPFMEELDYYLSLFTTEHIRTMQQARGRLAAVYIYLGEKTDFLIIKLTSYLQMGNFAVKYYLISPEQLQAEAKAMFKGAQIIHLVENSLFTADQYQEVQELEEESRRQHCLDRAVMLIREEPYLTL